MSNKGNGLTPHERTIRAQGEAIGKLTRERNKLQGEVDKLNREKDPERNFSLFQEQLKIVAEKSARITELDAEILALNRQLEQEREGRVAAEVQTEKFSQLLEKQNSTLDEVNQQASTLADQCREFAKQLGRKRTVSKLQRWCEIVTLVLLIPALLVVLGLMNVGKEVWGAKAQAVSAQSAKTKAEAETKRVYNLLDLSKEKEIADTSTMAHLRQSLRGFKSPKAEIADPHIGVLLQSPLCPPTGSIAIRDIDRTIVVDNTENPIDSQRELNFIRVRKFMNNMILATANASITIDTSPRENAFVYDVDSCLRMFHHSKSTKAISIADALNEVLGEAGLKYISENCLVEYRTNVVVTLPESSSYGSTSTTVMVSFVPSLKKFVEIPARG